MAVEKWVAGAGAGLTWTAAFSTEVNSLANTNAILSSIQIDNGTALDMFADVSIDAGGTITAAAPNYIGLYLYPLNQDGSSYGDGRFGTAAVGPPPGAYSRGQMAFPTGSVTIHGTIERIILPPGTFKLVLYNMAGATLHSTMTVKYRTYNRAVA